MKKSFAIIGLGRFGLSLVEELATYTEDIIAIDTDEKAVEKAAETISQAFVMDSTNEKALREVGIQNVDHAIISFGSRFEASILTLVTLKNLEIPRITVRVDNDHYLPIFQKLGATDIISPQRIAGVRLANRVASDNFNDYFKITNDFCIVEVSIRPDIEPVNLIQLDSRNKFGVNIILVRHQNKNYAPSATDVIYGGDTLFVFGKSSNILKFTNYISGAAIKKDIELLKEKMEIEAKHAKEVQLKEEE